MHGCILKVLNYDEQYNNNVYFEGIIVIGTPLCEVGARQLSICSPRAVGPRAANGQLEVHQPHREACQ